MSENDVTTEPDKISAAEQAKGDTSNKLAKTAKKGKATNSQISKRVRQQATEKEPTNRPMQSTESHAKSISELSQKVDKQSKRIQQLESRIASLQKDTARTSKTVSDAMTFMKNRGWKKKGKK